MLSFLSIKYLQTVSLLHYLSACHVCYCFINLIKLTLCCNTVLQRMFFSFMSQYVHYHIHDLGVLMHACQDVKPAENTRSYYIKEKKPREQSLHSERVVVTVSHLQALFLPYHLGKCTALIVQLPGCHTKK